MTCECDSNIANLPALPLRDPWYPENGFRAITKDPNVWCAACAQAWKASPKDLARSVATAEAQDRELADAEEAIKTRKKLEAWEAWANQPDKETQ